MSESTSAQGNAALPRDLEVLLAREFGFTESHVSAWLTDAGEITLLYAISSAEHQMLDLDALAEAMHEWAVSEGCIDPRCLLVERTQDAELVDREARALHYRTLAASERLLAWAEFRGGRRVAARRTDTAPQGEVERALAEIWQEVLGSAVTDRTQSVFALGGSSLALARIAARVHATFELELPLEEVFERPRLFELATTIERLRSAGGAVRLEPLLRAPRDGRLPLSAAQRSMRFLWELAPESGAYNVYGALRLRGRLDSARLFAALNALVTRHEILRTTFPEHDGVPYQQIAAAAPITVRELDVSLAAHPEGSLAEALLADAIGAFDLVHGPLLRVSLVRVQHGEHVLALTLHHSIADGIAMNNLVAELVQLYAAAGEGGPAPALQYADYAHWQAERLANGEAARQLAYWTARLGREHTPLPLPLDHPRPEVQRFHGQRAAFELDEVLVARVRAFAAERGASIFSVLLAALNVLLYRYTSVRDLRVGVPGHNRLRREAETMLGCFVNTQVVRSELDPHSGFDALVLQVQKHVQAAQVHQALPFETLVEALQPERSPAYNPLFQVMYNHQVRDLRALTELSELEISLVAIDAPVARCDLSLHTEEDGEGKLQAAWVYDSALFAPERIAGMSRHFRVLLAALVDAPTTPLARQSVLDSTERARVSAFSAGASIAKRSGFVHDWFEVQAQSSPNACALIFRDERVTYAELLQRVSALSGELLRRGAGPDSVIAVMIPRSIELVVAVLASLRAGAAYLPLDAEQPALRSLHMLREAGAELLLAPAESAVPDTLRAACEILALDTLMVGGGAPSPQPVAAANLAYVLYTSGSTGLPKAVGVPHAAVVERLSWMQHTYGLTPSDVLLHKTPLTFDVSVWELLWPLTSGACLAIAEPDDHRDPQRLARLIQRHGVSTIHFVPSLLREFVAEPESARCHSLVRLFSGGEALSQELAQSVLARFAGLRLDNRYGPTEGAINATCWTCLPGETGPVPIGRPLANTLVRILDGDLLAVPAGVTGELYLGGPGLARGYIGQPVWTAERFVPDPYAQLAGQRLYRTGDLARFRPDGTIEYLGRNDQQIKVRGIRVELAEIEESLRADAGVLDAAVTAHASGNTGTRLVAYVVLAPGAQLLDVERGLALRLPAHMLPTQLVALEAMPRLASGKLDRARLPQPSLDEGARTYSAPIGPFELPVAEIWRDVMQLTRVGRDDDFFALGGHSLTATQVVSRVRRHFDIELPLRVLFESRRLAAFCEHVAQAVLAGRRDRQPPVLRAERSQQLQLSYAQERMWFLWKLEPSSAAYNVGGAVRLFGSLHSEALERALHTMVVRHETLRTTFPMVDGEPVQRIAAHASLPLTRVDFSAEDDADREAQLAACARAEVELPFDLEHGPVIRAALIRMAHDEHVLVVTLHHIVAEGWAMDVFARECSALYEAYAQGESSPLAPLEVQYADYAAWQRRWLDDGEAERQLAYWRATLAADVQPVLELPADRARPAVQSFRGDYHRFVLDAELSAAVRAFAAEQGCTLSMTLMASLSALFYRMSGQAHVRIGYPIANRARPEFEGLIGAFLNTQVLTSQLTWNMSASELLLQVRDTSLDAQSHQDVPFHRIVEAVAPERSAAHSPLFQVMCNVQRWAFQQTQRIGDLRLEFMTNDARAAQFDLAIDVSDVDARLDCAFSFSLDLFDRATIERLANAWQRLLVDFVTQPQRRIGQLRLVDDVERAALLRASAGPQATFGAQELLHERFERLARLQGAAPAVVHAAETLTYAALNRRANQLAHALRAEGVGPETLVGVCAERTPRAIVALLAVLKAGGAYVPLDPEHPADHLAFMIADCGARLVLRDDCWRDRLPAAGVRYLSLDDAEEVHAALPEHDLPRTAAAANVAYCIYTSGSTGRPKGVLGTHSGVQNRLVWLQSTLQLQAADRVLQKTPPGFDVSLGEILLALTAGAALVQAPAGAQRDPAELARTIRRERVTVVDFVPALLQALVASGELATCNSLRAVTVGGEALPVSLARAFRQAHPAALYNMYGPTEASIDVSCWLCGDELGRSVPIGQALANNALYVLDAELAPVPHGVIGELYIAGVSLGRGYHARAALTAERFVPNPFSAHAERMYRTGDLARWRSDGALEFVGRTDEQVKLRGFRIELAEIEARLREQPGVLDAAVALHVHGAGRQLVGYVVAAGVDPERCERVLCASLARVLPEYMVPARIVVLAGLPLTVHGKLDRARLPAPPAPRSDHAEPQNALEAELLDVWRSVLGVAEIGVEDNFFELGGDSIISLQVVSRARERGLTIVPRALFQHQTVRSLATVAQHELPALPAAAAVQAPASGVYPLTPMQQGMLFHSLFSPDSTLYMSQLSVDVTGLDVPRFAMAFQRAIDRHEILRTGFVLSGDERRWTQVVHARATLRLQEQDHRALSAEDQRAALRALQVSERSDAFELAAPPLLKLVLVRTGERAHRLLWTHHHVLLDGWSTANLIGEVLRTYAGDPPSGTPPQYREHLTWLAATRATEAASEAFFRERVAVLSAPTLLAAALPAPATDATGQGQLACTFSPARSQELQSYARREHITLNTLVQGAWLVLLQRYTGQRAPAFGATVAGRSPDVADSEAMLGLFINTLPVIAQVPSATPSAAWLRALQDQVAQLREHEQTALSDIQRWAGTPGQALFDTLLVFENYPIDRALRERGGADLHFGALESADPTNYPLTLEVSSSDGSLRFHYAYDRSKLDGDAVARLARHLESSLAWLVAHPELPLARASLLSGEEHAAQRALQQHTEVAFDSERLLAQDFEHHAAHSGEACALVFGAEQLSYAELNGRANQLAHWLRAEGVTAGALVGIYAERSVELVVAVLAVLKTGAGYVPLEPEYPAERIAYMVQDSQLAIVLTQSALRAQLQVPNVRLCALDEASDELAAQPTHDLGQTTRADAVAYCMYTSGSTGQPKGVLGTHRGVHNRLAWLARELQLSAADRVLLKTAFSFDVSLGEILLPLGVGGRLVIAAPGAHRDPAALASEIQRAQVTVADFVPSLLQALVSSGELARCTTLRAVTAGGEALPPSLAQRFAASHTARLYNMYGPTEASIDVTSWLCGAEHGPSVPIGRALQNCQVYVLDAELAPAAIGVTGELYIAGAGLALGYHGRHALTAERFVPDPFGSQGTGARMYRTGDLGRLRADGAIEYAGRGDEQVKVRGYRVELGEIAARLAEHPTVQEAAVTLRAQQLVGYVVPAGLDESALRTWLVQRVPDYMVPARIVSLAEFPRTPNGKLDRARLPEPERSPEQHSDPETALEAALLTVWRETLGHADLGVCDNFFEAGGDSIISLQLVNRARERGLLFSPRDVFEQPSVRELTRVVTQLVPERTPDVPTRATTAYPLCDLSSAELAALPVSLAEVQDIYPLSPMQSGMLFHALFAGQSELYVSQLSVDVQGLDVPRFAAAWQAAIDRHDVLRTAFVEVPGRGDHVQVVYEHARLRLRELDLREAAAEQLAALEREERALGFDLGAAPVLRIVLARTTEHGWRLIWTHHHLVLDGWSVAALMSEVLATYGGSALADTAPAQYRDHIAWWLGRDRQTDERFWKARLAQLSAPTLLAGALPRRQLGTGHGEHACLWSADETERLVQCARGHRVTLNTLVQAAWLLLLARYTGQRSPAFGATIAGRASELRGSDSMLGLFIETVPVVEATPSQAPLGSWLESLQRNNAAVREHAALGLGQLQKLAGQPGQPLFDTLLVFENYPVDSALRAQNHGLQFGAVTTVDRTNYPLTLSVAASPALRIDYDYQLEQLDPSSVERVAEHLRTLLTSLADAPASLPIGRLGMLPAHELAQRAAWNDTAAAFDRQRLLHESFAAHAARDAHATALVCAAETLNYGELNRRANQLAHWLRAQGIGPDSLVGVCAERSPELVVALLAVLKAGGAYVPLDPEYPSERLDYMLQDSGVSTVLTQARFAAAVSGGGRRVFCLDTDWQALAALPVSDPPRNAHPEHAAYCLYTSGSTGRPKGAINTHLALQNRLHWMQNAYALTPDDRVLQKTPFGFDVSVWEFFWPLSFGAVLVMAEPGVHRDPVQLAATIRTAGVTTLHFVPSMLRAFVDSGELSACTTLRQVISSGEALPADLARAFTAQHSAALHNLYGPTEAAIDVTHWHYRDEPNAVTVPIGRPIHNCAVHVVDVHGALAPIDGVGEVLLGGVGLARAYLKRAAQTAERFVPDPFGPPGARAYRTGDLARVRPDGAIDYVGRSDDQVKLRGQRIELGEIESRLREHPDVRDAVVVLREHAGAKHLAGYVAATSDQDLALRAWLRVTLPEYMVPTTLTVLPALPLSPNGKVDRKRLPAPALEVSAYVAPESAVEHALCALFGQLLDAPQVGLDDNFFELGGDSILSLQVVSRARAQGIVLSPRDVFERQTVRALAAAAQLGGSPVPVERHARARAANATLADFPLCPLDEAQLTALPVHPSELDDIYPLSPMQEGMLFHALYAPVSSLYVSQLRLPISGLDVERFTAAASQLVARHEILRSSFVEVPGRGGHVQVVYKHAPLRLQRLDLRAEPAPDQRLDELAAREHSEGFQLDQPPLLKLLLVRVADDRHELIWTHHHIVLDGWSVARLLDELLRAYAGQTLADHPGRYREHIAWLLSRDPALAEAFWRRSLEPLDAPVLLAEALAPVPAQGACGPCELQRTWSRERTARLAQFARSQRVTINTLVQAAWVLLLTRYTERATVVFGATVAGRAADVPEAEAAIGLFINTVPVVQTPHADSTVADFLHALQAQNVALREHEHTALADIQRWAGSPGQALFDTLIVFENYPIERTLRERSFGALQFGTLQTLDHTHYPLTLECAIGDELHFGFAYQREAFDDVQVERLARHFEQLLDGLAADPARRLGRIGMLSQPERAQLLAWNETAAPYPSERCLHQGFEAWAATQPDAIALVRSADGATLNYGTLNQRANQLARLLRSHGLGPGSLIGLCVERSFEMVVGLFGILKAGAGYVPLDPEYPADRLAYMLRDSGARWVVTAGDVLARVPQSDVRSWSFDRDWGQAASLPEDDLHVVVPPAAVAYCIYTSGSTGQPKGVLGSHRGVQNRVTWLQRELQLTAADRVLHKTPLSFDVALGEVLLPLTAGATLVLAPPGAQREPAVLAAAIRETRVTLLDCVPAQLQALLDSGELAGCESLRALTVGGEALPVPLVHALRAVHTARLYNMYGPTEAAIDVSCFACDDVSGPSVPIGLPLANTSLHVLDRAGELAPVGVTGELYIGGVALAHGYLGRAALTAERFVPDPFGAPGSRLYRTGDRVRRRADGLLEYVGRSDEQVKIRGFRVELGEIAAQLRGQAQVQDAAVVAREHGHGKLLVAYVMASVRDAALFETALRQQLSAALPMHMVPARIVVLPELPRLPNGKLDRKRLPALDPSTAAQLEPETALEELIASLWREVLGLESVGVEDNFFELGGDSIVSLQVVSRAREHGIEMSPRDLFHHQTVRALAKVAHSELKLAPVQGPVTGEVVLTPVQRRYFAEPGGQRDHFNQAIMVTPQAPVDPAALAAAIAQLEAHHDALRLRFEQLADGSWRQWHASIGEPEQPRLQVRSIADAEALHAACADAQRSLHLTQGPLLRALLCRLWDGSERLLFVVHHLVVDGVSWRVMMEDLGEAYRACVSGEAPRLPPKTTSYRAWAARLEQHARSEALTQDLDYYRRGADEPALFELPCERPDGSRRVDEAEEVHAVLSAEWTRRLLRQAPQAYRTQVNDLLLTALARVLCAWADRPAVWIELEGHGREDLFPDVDLSRTVGWFTSIFPVRLEAERGLGAKQIARAIKGVKEQLRAIPHNGIGFGVLAELGEPDVRAQLAKVPRPRVTFNYLGQLDQGADERALFRLAQEGVGPSQSDDTPLANWLNIDGAVTRGELTVTFSFSRAMYDRATVEALARDYRDELEVLIAHCTRAEHRGATPSDFPLAGLTQLELDAWPVPVAELDDIYPLSPMQEGLVFHSLYEHAANTYVNQQSIAVQGLDTTRFTAAWDLVVSRHEILRTGFTRSREGRLLQIVHKRVPSAVRELDLRGRATPDALAQLAERERTEELKLDQPPLQRVLLVRVGEDQHELIWTVHHVLLDGWSAARLIEEVLEHYMTGRSSRSGARYRDYIAWLSQQERGQSERFWRAELSRLDEPTYLCRTQSAGSAASPVHARVTRAWTEPRMARLSQFARQERVTINTLVQAAWVLLLRQHTGQAAVAFGCTVSGRPSTLNGVQTTLGLFINTLVVIERPSGAQSVGQWLRALQEHNLALREFEHTPLYDVQRWAGHSGRALFDSLLVFENYPVDQVLREKSGAHVRWGHSSTVETTHYALTVEAMSEAVLELNFGYATDHFTRAEVEAIADQLDHWLEQLTVSAVRPLHQLAPLSERAAATVMAYAFGKQVELDLPTHALFERQAGRTPHATAVRSSQGDLSYAELARRSNQLAHTLRTLGVKPDELVGLCLPRSLDLVVAMLAVWKAGAGYLALDPAYPLERLSYQIADSGVQHVITRGATVLALDDRLCLERDAVRIAAEPDDAPPALQSHPESTAYCIYTSGSTGRPKGTLVPHVGLANHMRWMRDTFPLTPEDRVLQKTSPSFDASVWEFWLPLITGAQLVLATDDQSRDPLQLLAAITRERVSVLQLVPSLLAALLQVERAQAVLGGLRYLFAGGEALDPTLVRALPPGVVHNLYGPTEATIDATWWSYTQDREVAIGRPIDNVRAYVLGPAFAPVPVGVIGELWLGGRGLARGYRDRPGLTAERFVPDRFGGEPGARLYRTGDLARWGHDGALEYAGRADEQLKIRGQRVEPGEIEARLREHPHVAEAAVCARTLAGVRQLVGYVSPKALATPHEPELKAHLRALVPDALVPARIVVLRELPRMPNGKLDRRALPDPERFVAQYIAPESPVGQRLAAIWAEVLTIDRVGAADNFFELGGDSVLAMQVVAHVEAKLRVSVSLRSMFDADTLADFEAAVVAALDASATRG